MKKAVTIFLCLFLLLPFLSEALDTTSYFDFSVTLDPTCIISNSPSLSMYYALGQDGTGNFSVNYVCSSGLNYTITVGGGRNADSTSRQAKKDPDKYVRYRLYWDSAYTSEIGVDSQNTAQGTGTANQESKTIYARVLAADNPSPEMGTYTDTLTITISW
jgi:spore coat protein U-like protein